MQKFNSGGEKHFSIFIPLSHPLIFVLCFMRLSTGIIKKMNKMCVPAKLTSLSTSFYIQYTYIMKIYRQRKHTTKAGCLKKGNRAAKCVQK